MAKRKDPREPRPPTLADRFLAAVRSGDQRAKLFHPKAVDTVYRGVINAEKFVFDVDACKRIAEVVMKVPELLLREHQFARAPFDLCWIEWPSWHYWMEFVKANPDRYNAADEWGDPETADRETGYLIDHGRVNVVSYAPKAPPGKVRPADMIDTAGTVGLTPMQYRLHTEWPVEDQIEFATRIGVSRMGIDTVLWGSTWDAITDKNDRRLLRAYNLAEFVPLNPKHPMIDHETMQAPGGMARIMRGCIGELRTIVALLLMLNRPSLTRYLRRNENTRGFIRGKLSPFMAHRTITVELDPVPKVRLIGTANDDPDLRRRHKVKRHYCHDRTARDMARIAGCIHEWVGTYKDWTPCGGNYPLADIDNWLCSQCGGKRWQRDEHYRGHAALGFVTNDYEVTDHVD